MDNIPVHLKISSVEPTNEEVDSRRSAVANLVETWRKLNQIDVFLAKASETAEALSGDGTPPAGVSEEVQAAVQKHASAFLSSDKPLDVGIVAGMAVIQFVKPATTSDWTFVDILAVSLWSALSYVPPLGEQKREALRTEVLGAVEDRVLRAAEAGRTRSPVADFGALEILNPTEEAKPLTSNFSAATAATITALRRNAALDREELDFLWWSQLARSRVLRKPLTAIAEPVRLVACGIEGAEYLRRLPCEVHRDLVLRTVNKDPELDLKQLLDAIGANRDELGSRFAGGFATKWPSIFPLISALATGETDAPHHSVKRKASEWGGRALLEAGLVKLLTNGVPKL